MIILCTRCQAKFRVADEKIGPRGAKVRCSKCGNVFAVHRDAGTVAAPAPSSPASREPAPVEAPARTAPPQPAPGLRALDIELESRTDLRAPPPPAARPVPSPVLDDPFAPIRGVSGDPGRFAVGAETEGDPFAAPATAPVPVDRDPDPFASAAPSPGGIDPSAAFAEAALGDPFVAAVVPRSAPSLATDPSQLLGAAAGAGSPDLAPSALELGGGFAPGDFGAGSGLELGASGGGFGFELDRSAAASEAPFASPSDAIPLDAAPPASTAAAASPSAFSGLLSDPALAAPPPAARLDAPRAPAPSGDAAAEAPADAPGRSPLRALAVNAVSLAALLCVALALVVVWRGGGSLSAALRTTPLLSTLAGAPPAAPAFAARDVTSGLYDRADGPPILYVRGAVVSHAAAPVAGVKVRVEIVRGGAVVARGEALAGAVPTPEELHAVRDAADLARRVGEWTRRAPVRVRPGDALPFLVAIEDVPADVGGATVRVAAGALEPRR